MAGATRMSVAGRVVTAGSVLLASALVASVALGATNGKRATRPRPPRTSGAGQAPASNPLRIPPLLAPSSTTGGVDAYDLTARAGTNRVDGATRDTAGYNGTYLAPTIRLRRGEHVQVHVTNAMTEATTVHWHGLHVPAAADGGPYQPIEPGTTWSPAFTVSQQATTLWYHPHLMGHTAEQVGRGMAGALIIDDPASAAQAALPHRYGVDDVPVLVQHDPGATGGNGGRLLANGVADASLRARTSRVRLRLVNATSGDVLGFSVGGATAAWQVGSDGGLLARPLRLGHVVLGPSERAEIVVDVRAGQRAQVMSTRLEDRGADGAAAQAAFVRGTAVAARGRGTQRLLEVVGTSSTAAPALPQSLNTITQLDTSTAVERPMDLGPRLTINGMQMRADEPDPMDGTIGIPLDETDVWTVANHGDQTHAFHVHDIEFQVVSRDGAKPPPAEGGWKDTVRVAPGESVRIAMRFTDFADASTPYMYHCHVLRHEDAGMMGQFVVLPPGTTLPAASTIDGSSDAAAGANGNGPQPQRPQPGPRPTPPMPEMPGM